MRGQELSPVGYDNPERWRDTRPDVLRNGVDISHERLIADD